MHNKHRELKDKLRSINQGFERLRKVSHQGYDATSGTIQHFFMFIWYQFHFLQNQWESNDYLVSQYMVLLLRAEKIEPGCSIYKLTLKA